MMLKVFGLNVPVIKQKDLLKERGWAGYYDILSKKIYIDPSLKGDEYTSTLIHECLHAVFHRVGFEQINISRDAHELMVENFSNFLVENFKITKK